MRNDRKPAIPGDRFGRLTVLSCEYRPHLSPSRKGHFLAWAKCLCDCGKEREVSVNTLRSGLAESCGCQRGKYWLGRARSHGGCIRRADGKTWEPLYQIFHSIHCRCNGTAKTAVKHYSAKGITVCAEWKSYVAFREWALLHGYEPGLTIERIDSDGNYEPENCEWITRAENTRRANAKRKAREDWMVREIMRLTAEVAKLSKVLEQNGY